MDWRTAAVKEGARVIRLALTDWGRTTRLCVIAVALALAIGALGVAALFLRGLHIL